MILTPIPPERLSGILAVFAAAIAGQDDRQVFRRIAQPARAARARGAEAEAHRREALSLASSFGMAVVPGPPGAGFSWDGTGLRAETEAYVLLHEVAHYQLSSPERRAVVDFGLGPGPETGARERAEHAARLFGLAREREEAMASLLGILWEVELGHPALASFLDQNWLEGAGRPATSDHYRTILAALRAGGFVTSEGRPTRQMRLAPDPAAADREGEVPRSTGA